MIIKTKAGWTNTKTGEIVPPPRTHYDSHKISRTAKRARMMEDVAAALAIYSLGATLLIIGLLA